MGPRHGQRARQRRRNELQGSPAIPTPTASSAAAAASSTTRAEGIRKLAIAPGRPSRRSIRSAFAARSAAASVGAFKDIGPRNKPSGFEENLNFGLGVNQLTPGQKNVLIFGGFALAFAFFLSLYSLR